MINIIYDTVSGLISRTINMPDYYTEKDMGLLPNESMVTAERMPNDVYEMIVDGVLVERTDIVKEGGIILDSELNQWIESPELQAYTHLEEQEQAWEGMKQLRYRKMTGGVYVPSLNKWVHTDEAAATQYAFIGLRIMQGTYTPIVWKAMDNTFIQLSEEVFIELQERMMEQTQTIHAKAEYHKLMMEASENPLEYDYTTNWE